MSENLPIGIFDSGIGGLTVARAIMNRLPSEGILYLGDTARVPYGTRSADTVHRYAMQGTRFLLQKGIKLLVVACNTMSAVTLDAMVRQADVPVVGVLLPGAEAAAKNTRSRKVGVIGTAATVQSSSYEKAIRKGLPDAEVIGKACPLFVPLVEEGWLQGDVPELAARHYLDELRAAGIDTLVLGCTHYPLLKGVIAKVMGPDITLIDSAEETARTVHEELAARGLAAGSANAPVREFFVTDSPEGFRSVGERFLNQKTEHISRVQLEVD